MSVADWVDVAVGLGSNLDNPDQQLLQACKTLSSSPLVKGFRCSGFFYSKPQGPQDQPDFVNAVCRFSTSLPPQDLLDWLQQIEQQQGRVKYRHWGERLIDLDILLYGDQLIQKPGLVIPHRHLSERDFVLVPLAEIWSDVVIPGMGGVQTLLSQLEQRFVIE